MHHRTVRATSTPAPLPGSGILRPFPSAALRHADPFVFLDTGAPMQLGDREIVVAPHAHRGVQPVSLLFRGRIAHRDSLGTERAVASGGMQWLVAGSGALHEEVLGGDDDGVFHMAQLWINVPAARKMDPPEHHAVGADAIPEWAMGAATVRLYAGELDGRVGPAPMPTPVTVAYVDLPAGGSVGFPAPPSWTAAVTVVAGTVAAGGESGDPGTTWLFEQDGAVVSLHSEEGGAVLYMAGEPIAEPVATGGGFVMNTASEIRAAFDDLAAGRMGSLTASR